MPPRRYKATTISAAERLWMHSTRGPGCWLWTGAVGNHGYGVLRHDSVDWLAHRFAYTLLVEPIPGDLTIDHLCCNKVCINPSHMEVVTRAENARRGEKLRRTRSGGRAMAARTHCKHGHRLSGDNIRVRGGARICRSCARDRKARFMAAHR